MYTLLLVEGGLLSAGGTLLGLVLSRVAMVVLSAFVEQQFHYSLGAMMPLPGELALAATAVAVGLVASAIPARRTLRLDISKTLSEA